MQTKSIKSYIARLASSLCRITFRRSVWICSCGYIVPKGGVVFSGDDWSSQGFHVHCPNCGRIVAQFVDPKRVGQ